MTEENTELERRLTRKDKNRSRGRSASRWGYGYIEGDIYYNEAIAACSSRFSEKCRDIGRNRNIEKKDGRDDMETTERVSAPTAPRRTQFTPYSQPTATDDARIDPTTNPRGERETDETEAHLF